MDSGIHSSLYPILNLNLKINYRPVCDGKSDIFKRLMLIKLDEQQVSFLGNNLFANANVNEKVRLFNQTVQNIMFSYIFHETITCVDKNPQWIDEKMPKMPILKIKITLIVFW